MSRANTLFVLGLACGAGLGLLASGSFQGRGMDAAPGQMSDHAGDHDHDQIIVVDPAPTLALTLQPEGNCTYNLHIETTNFRFAPENANSAHLPGEGHAHLYAGDTKLARVYGNWFHFTAPAGSTSISVTLNSNDHATLSDGSAAITATAPLPDC